MGMDPEPITINVDAEHGAAPIDAITDAAVESATAPVARLLTDEGVPFEWIDTRHIVNLTDDTTSLFDARRRELHIAAVSFSHVGEDGWKWVYRDDR